ncbi:MAG: hypothetical protein M3Q44_00350 [bacterium]|nr:hypothetical protein [bacterium]
MHKIFLILVLFFTFAQSTYAAEPPTITIVNPLRGPQLGLGNQDLHASLKSQWQYTKDASVSATWLWQYSALENDKLTRLAKTEMQNQEHGIFLEIDKNSAEKSGVRYKGRNQWYHSDGLLLVSYDLYERRKIIDSFFEKFHDVYSYYPTSVGAWWVGSDAINYMKEKYNITAVLQCADQFETDAYSIWGTPWSIPYLSRTNNAAVPATDYESSSKAVIMQWAPRDPNRAYGDSVTHSTFSMQDYSTKSYDLRYIEYLQNIFLKQEGDQVVFGLEGGVIPTGYKDYGAQVKQTKQWENEGKLIVHTMKEYSDTFLKKKITLPSSRYFLTQDYETTDQAFWYHSTHFRLAIQKKGNKISLIDLRDYTNTSPEDFNQVPNTQKLLRINTKAIIDSIRLPEQLFTIGDSEKPMVVEEQENTVIVKTDNRTIAEIKNNFLKINDKTYTFNKENIEKFEARKSEVWWLIKKEEIKNDIGAWKETVLTSRKQLLKSLIAAYLMLGSVITLIMLIKQRNYKLAVLVAVTMIALPVLLLYFKLTKPTNIELTEFESEVLEKLISTDNNIAYMEPDTNLEFRAVQPFLYAKQPMAEDLTGRKWQYVRRTEGFPLEMELKSGTILIVPRYLGQEIYSNEVPEFALKKMYDNGQIVLYQRN